MENAPPLLIITTQPLFVQTLADHLNIPCTHADRLPPVMPNIAGILFLPESLSEVMRMEEEAARNEYPSLLLLPEEASRSRPSCRSLQRPTTISQLKAEIHYLLQQPRSLRWPDVGSFDPAGMHLHNLFGQSISLTEKEAALLTYLGNRQDAVTREELLEAVWRYHPESETHTLETHLYRLRQKLQEIFGDKLQIVNEGRYSLHLPSV